VDGIGTRGSRLTHGTALKATADVGIESSAGPSPRRPRLLDIGSSHGMAGTRFEMTARQLAVCEYF
jgi:hypothetical protein